MKSNKEKLVQLFFSTLYLSAFTFGGGYVIVTLMKKKFVDDYHWIDEKEMLDLIAIAQSAPGPVAINGAIVVGLKLGGIAGLLTAIFATVLPPFIIISIISFCYQIFAENVVIALLLQGMQIGVGAVIADVVFEMGSGIVKEKNWISVTIMILVFWATYILDVNVIYIILFCGLLGVLYAAWEKRKE